MQQFLKKIGFLGMIVIAVNALIFIVLQRKSFAMEVENKRTAFIEESIENPKMIVSGGSNVGYSLDSELLTEKLKIPVFNVSFYISHDYEFVLNYIASNLKKGDTFLYIPEYDNYYLKNENIMSDALCVSIYNKPSFFQHLSFKQKVNFLTKVPKINILSAYKNLKYIFSDTKKTISKTNERGDYIAHLDKPRTWQKSAITRYEKNQYNGRLSIHFKNTLLKAKEIAESKGATFYVAFPSIAASQFDSRFKEDVEKFYKNTNITVIGTPENYIFPDNMIQDHAYHTTKKGKTVRTNLLISDIQKVLNKN